MDKASVVWRTVGYLGVALSVAAGMTVVWSFLASLMFANIPATRETVVVTTRGDVVVRIDTDSDGPQSTQWRKLDGTAVEEKTIMDRGQMQSSQQSPNPPPFDSPVYWSSRVVPLGDLGAERWFFVIHRLGREGLVYFAGFDRRSQRPIGYLGRSGRRDTLPSEADMIPFVATAATAAINAFVRVRSGATAVAALPHRPWGDAYLPGVELGALLLSDGRLWLVDCAAGTSSAVSDVEGIRSLGTLLQDRTPAQPIELLLFVQLTLLLRTDTSVALFDPTTRTTRVQPLPLSLRSASLSYYPLNDKEAVAVVHRTRDFANVSDVVWLSADGSILREQNDVVVVPSITPAQAMWGFVVLFPGVPGYLLGLASMMSSPFQFGFGEALQWGWPALAFALALGLVLGGLAWRRQRQRGCRDGWIWFVFALLLGPAGYLGYLTHRRSLISKPIAPRKPTGIEVFA